MRYVRCWLVYASLQWHIREIGSVCYPLTLRPYPPWSESLDKPLSAKIQGLTFFGAEKNSEIATKKKHRKSTPVYWYRFLWYVHWLWFFHDVEKSLLRCWPPAKRRRI